jgi:hypothetical protein
VYASFSSITLSVAGNMTYASSDYTVSASSQFNTTIWNPYSVFNSNTAYGWISKTVLTIKFWKIYRDNRHDSGLWIIHIWRMDSNQMPYYSVAASYVVESISSTKQFKIVH